MVGEKDFLFLEERLTYRQIKYVEALSEDCGKRGRTKRIADICGVQHSTVSRFLTDFKERGCLTENFRLNSRGEAVLNFHKKLLEDLRRHFKNTTNLEGDDIEKIVETLMDSGDFKLIKKLSRSQRQQACAQRNGMEQVGSIDVSEILKKGSSKVALAVFSVEKEKSKGLSMADRGIEHIGLLTNGKRGKFLQLKAREIKATSKISGVEMKGRLRSIKYIKDGVVYEVAIKDNKVKIPIEACSFQQTAGRGYRGSVDVIFSVSVGEAHMPESSARVMFYL